MGLLRGSCKAGGMTGSNEMSTAASLTAFATTDDVVIAVVVADDAATAATTADADRGWVLSKSANYPIEARSVEVRSWGTLEPSLYSLEPSLCSKISILWVRWLSLD